MSISKKHIVLLTTWFPPLQSVAVNRMEAFARYLDFSKYDLSVITQGTAYIHGKSNENGYTVFRIKPAGGFMKPTFKSGDSALSHKMKVALRLVRQQFVADEDKQWSNDASQVLADLHHSRPVDLILSSFSPVAPHLVALDFKKKFQGTKWVVDMRDEMSLNPQSSKNQRAYYEKIEQEIAVYASALISVSSPIVHYFEEAIPGLPHYMEVRNGFDHEMDAEQPVFFNEEFVFLHAGSFYGTRKPDSVFEALAQLKKQGHLPERWKFICAGAARNFSIPPEIEEHVVLKERVSQQESIAWMKKADVNVLIQPHTGRLGVYTGKVFDYLSVLRPVLAAVDEEDVAAALIRECQAGYVASFSDVKGIEQAILQLISDWKNKRALAMNITQIKGLHRKIQIQKLNLLFDRLLHES